MLDKELIKHYLRQLISGLITAAFAAAVLLVPLVKEQRLNRRIDGDYTGIIPAPENNVDDVVYININTASEHQLQRLHGIGETTARAVVKYRETHGEFKSADELLNVKGIGEKTLEKFRDRIIV
ncbi:MAG: helix-hairpin-helix domain-containing protein [Oscillospiraceae bacterium]|nr:helix-hairpin-helix domain-containing protein [Oscillospiraceae bacterium]